MGVNMMVGEASRLVRQVPLTNDPVEKPTQATRVYTGWGIVYSGQGARKWALAFLPHAR